MFISVLVLLTIVGLSEEMMIRVNQGPLKSHTTKVGRHAIYVFKNIPYAKQPVGNLRFERPEDHDGWLSEDELPVHSKIRCPQHEFYDDEEEFDSSLGQEDCLYLDIYLRKDSDIGNMSLPVVVYFHGGLFRRGSKEDYGPDFLLRYSNIILVVPNYRLGILGFLSHQDGDLPGNLGLWDQNAALKWVSKNIEYFGGDPLRVTIAGHEAGAASVGLHILASASHDYFQGAVSDSGTALTPWLIDTDPQSSAVPEVAKNLHCSTNSKDEMLQCLKTVPLKDILAAQGHLNKIAFLPTVDNMAENPFIPYHPKTLYERGYQKNVNYLIGFTENEASFEVAREFPKVLKYHHLDKMIHHFLQPYFKNAINFEAIVTAAKYHYLRGIMIPTFESMEPQIAKLMTDFLYQSPLHQVLRLHRQKTGNVFVYVFKKDGKSCGLENRKCFGNEYYVFNASHENIDDEMQPDVRRAIETVSKVWGDFISSGHPDERKVWQRVLNVDELHYAEISDIMEPKARPWSDDSEFWISLVSDLQAAGNVSVEPLDDIQAVSEYSTIGTWGAAGLAILCGVLCVALVGLVVITKRRTLTMSLGKVSNPKDLRISRG
uniref:Carboxylesterase 2 n=1 Tax=Pardosa astrigera TaxID=317848 RepID=A0A977XVR5_PARAW|nr:carboxylesterase 2 [Pardosa astrigera]